MIEETLSKPIAKPVEKPKAIPSPPKPTLHKGRQVVIEGVTYENILVGNKEYVDIGLYYKALEAFFKASGGTRAGDRS